MTEDLRSPRFADQIVMHEDAAVRFKLPTGFERQDEILMSQADQLSKVTVACTPGLERPALQVAPGLFACGDYVDGPYPATREGAVRSARQAVAALSASGPAAR